MRHRLLLSPASVLLRLCTRTITRFSKQKPTLDQQLLTLAESIKPAANEDLSQLVNNYIQLEEGSFTQYMRGSSNDPQMMLMLLSSFEDADQIAQYLPNLYQFVDFYEGPELLNLLEKVLAFKPKLKPKVPFPKPLEGIESILVILGELFPADALVDWLRSMPTYSGREYYILFMGYLAVLEKMSPETKQRNQQLLIKCHERMVAVLRDQLEPLELRLGIITLAFELNYGQARLLLTSMEVDFETADPYKICLLYANIWKYQIRRKESQTGLKPEQAEIVNAKLKKMVGQMIAPILRLELDSFVKIELLVDLFTALGQQDELKGTMQLFAGKLVNLITHKSYQKSMHALTVEQLLVIFEAMERHKISSERALKKLLILFSPHLRNMGKKQFVRLLKCLVTYVRQCEEYLINVRLILEQRKLQFTPKDAVYINDVLRRVEVLFPSKFIIQ